MVCVERLRVAAVQEVQAGGEVVARSFDDGVVVVRHQAERVDVPAEAVRGEREEREERAPVVVAADDRDLACAPRRDVEGAVRWHR